MVNEACEVRVQDEVPQEYSEGVRWREDEQGIAKFFFFIFLRLLSDFYTLGKIEVGLFLILIDFILIISVC